MKHFVDFKYCRNGKKISVSDQQCVYALTQITQNKKNLKKNVDYYCASERIESEIIIVLIPTTEYIYIYMTLSHPNHFCIYMQFRADNATRYCSHDFPIAHGRRSECAEKRGGMCIVGLGTVCVCVCVCTRGKGKEKAEGVYRTRTTHAHIYTETRTIYVL